MCARHINNNGDGDNNDNDNGDPFLSCSPNIVHFQIVEGKTNIFFVTVYYYYLLL